MKFQILKYAVIVEDCEDFEPRQILECGQMFRYEIFDDFMMVKSADKIANIAHFGKKWIILSQTPKYFADFFDLTTEYSSIKNFLTNDPVIKLTIPYAHGVRIARADPCEILFSFVISANNNIPRIKQIIENLCLLGNNKKFFESVDACDVKKEILDNVTISECEMEKFNAFIKTSFDYTYHTFPDIRILSEQSLATFRGFGVGYRDKYLYNLSRQLIGVDLEEKRKLTTKQLREWLISLSGIGPKVADCALLFGFNKTDVFPVDTWVEKIYNKRFFNGVKTRQQISNFFVERFQEFSGYAQQYLFYSARSFDLLNDNV